MPRLTMGERMARMEGDVQYIKESVDRLHSKLEKHLENNDKRMLSLDKKYADKWVERAIYGTIALVMTAVGLAILGLIFIRAA